MKKKFLDPNLKNKSKTVEEKIQIFSYKNTSYPLPTEIEISESGTCNRTCSFCPRSASLKPRRAHPFAGNISRSLR